MQRGQHDEHQDFKQMNPNKGELVYFNFKHDVENASPLYRKAIFLKQTTNKYGQCYWTIYLNGKIKKEASCWFVSENKYVRRLQETITQIIFKLDVFLVP